MTFFELQKERFVCLYYYMVAMTVRPFARIRKNRLFFWSYNFDKYACNPRALTEYILVNCPNDYEIYWAFDSTFDVSKLDKSITKAGSGRGETWIKVWELIKQRPLFGYGLECLLFQFSGQFNVGEGRTHNLLLQLLATVGIPGTIMYFAALAIIFFRLLSNWKSWSDVEKITTFVGISYIVTALTGNSTYYTSPFFMMFLGFVALTQWKKKKEE